MDGAGSCRVTWQNDIEDRPFRLASLAKSVPVTHVLLLEYAFWTHLGLAPVSQSISAPVVTSGEARALLATDGVASILLPGRVAAASFSFMRLVCAWPALLPSRILVEEPSAQGYAKLIT